MSKAFSRTWWGQKFLAALEQLTDPGRLSRGRSYASGGRITSFEIKDGCVQATVRGSVNAYFGVYKEPLYITTIEFQPISQANWAAAIALMASKAAVIYRLLLNDIPDTIETYFKRLNLNLLPGSQKDFEATCSCPDWENPCKHIAGVYYLVAAELDQDPFLLFELRGISREALQQELAKTPLGQALSAQLPLGHQPPRPVQSYYTSLHTVAADPTTTSLRDFWHGSTRLPATIEALPTHPVSGILVKKQGDLPAFWDRHNSFLEAMDALYEKVRAKSRL